MHNVCHSHQKNTGEYHKPDTTQTARVNPAPKSYQQVSTSKATNSIPHLNPPNHHMEEHNANALKEPMGKTTHGDNTASQHNVHNVGHVRFVQATMQSTPNRAKPKPTQLVHTIETRHMHKGKPEPHPHDTHTHTHIRCRPCTTQANTHMHIHNSPSTHNQRT